MEQAVFKRLLAKYEYKVTKSCGRVAWVQLEKENCQVIDVALNDKVEIATIRHQKYTPMGKGRGKGKKGENGVTQEVVANCVINGLNDMWVVWKNENTGRETWSQLRPIWTVGGEYGE